MHPPCTCGRASSHGHGTGMARAGTASPPSRRSSTRTSRSSTTSRSSARRRKRSSRSSPTRTGSLPCMYARVHPLMCMARALHVYTGGAAHPRRGQEVHRRLPRSALHGGTRADAGSDAQRGSARASHARRRVPQGWSRPPRGSRPSPPPLPTPPTPRARRRSPPRVRVPAPWQVSRLKGQAAGSYPIDERRPKSSHRGGHVSER